MGGLLNQRQRILIAAAALPGDFALSDLVVRAYEDDRDGFGLDGYADKYPDSHRILAAVMGKLGLLNPARGYFVRVGKRYRMTARARQEAARLAEAEAPKLRMARTARPVLSEWLDRRISAAVNAPAFKRWRGGAGALVTLADALTFLGTDPVEVLGQAAPYFAGGELSLRSGQVVTPGDLDAAGRAAAFFRVKYAHRLNGAGR